MSEPIVGIHPLAFELGRMFWTAALGAVFEQLASRSGSGRDAVEARLVERHGPEASLYAKVIPRSRVAGEEKGAINMSYGSYDLVGSDDYGSIGYDPTIIGDDADALLEALSVEGDDLLISGLGDSEIIGAVKRAVQSAAAKKAAAVSKVAQRNMGAVVQRGLDRRRRYPLGFVPTTIAAATTSQIPSAPQNLYRPERLVIPSDIAFDSGVADIKIGNQSQLVQAVEVPGALFSEVAINTGVTFDTAEVGNQVSVNIRNKSAAAFEFSAGLVGTIAK